MKKIILACIGLLIAATTYAQQPMQEGQRSIAISANPVFSYLGNLFREDGSNGLNLSGSSAIYRKVYKPNRAFRLSANLDLDRSTRNYQAANLYGSPYSVTETYLFGRISVGQEFFNIAPAKNDHFWRWYGGYTFDVSGSLYHENYRYNSQPNEDRDVSDFGAPEIRPENIKKNRSLRGGVTGLVGVEYYFSDQFFVGLEARAIFYGGFRFNDITKERRFFYDEVLQQNVNLDRITNESGEGVIFGLDTGLPVFINVGFVF
jgi:hypothetical protein